MPEKPERISLLRIYKLATNAFDSEIGELVGLKRPLVQAYISGRATEYLNEEQKRILCAALRAHIEYAQEQLQLLELLA